MKFPPPPYCDDPEVKGAVYDLYRGMIEETGLPMQIAEVNFDEVKEITSNKKGRGCIVPVVLLGEKGESNTSYICTQASVIT